MIIRLTQKLAKKVNVTGLKEKPLDENPLADWSANLFTADRTQYIIVSNTKSLYTIVMNGRGITDDNQLINRALENIRETMEHDGLLDAYMEHVAPSASAVQFAKSLNRTVTGSINEFVQYAEALLTVYEYVPFDVGFQLNDSLKTAIDWAGSDNYGRPNDAIRQLIDERSAMEGDSACQIIPFPSTPPEGEGTVCQNSEAIPQKSSSKQDASEPTININLTKAQRIVISEILPEMTERLKIDLKNSRTISFTSDELKLIQQEIEEALVDVEDKMKRNSMWHIRDAFNKAFDSADSIEAIPSRDRIYQFKITLQETMPPIWRRIQIKNGTLDKLHERIQLAMGWEDSHLYEFEINGERYGHPYVMQDDYNEPPLQSSTRIKLDEVVPKDGTPLTFTYQYDFGDNWQHEIMFEGCLRAAKDQRYPLCVEGERACPPEDVGGVCGYQDYLEALADPKHSEHESYLEWRGPFDPESFDATKTTKKMQRGFPSIDYD